MSSIFSLTKRSAIGGLIAVAVSVALVACSEQSPDGEGAATELTVAATAPVPAGFPAYWLAEGFGFYDEEGLDVELVEPAGAAPALLLGGSLDVAGVGLDYIPEGADETRLKLVMTTDLQPFVMVTFEGSGVEEMSDFKGKTIGINDPHDETDAQFLLAAGGLSPDDYELVPVGEDAAALAAMENGDIIGFMGAFRGANLSLPEMSTRELHLIENPLGGFPGSGPMVSEAFLEENREAVVKFARALAKATIWQQENPELSAEVLLAEAPETAQDHAQMVEFIEIANQWHRSVYDDLLAWDEEAVQGYIDTFHELGFIDDSFPASQLVTNELQDEIFDFDVEAEKERARTATEVPNT